MTTAVYINDVPLDHGMVQWPIYRGTRGRLVSFFASVERFESFKAMAAGLNGAPATMRWESGKVPGSQRGLTQVTIPGVYVRRVLRVNDNVCRLDCMDGRLLLEQSVGDMDFNMTFGDGFLDGTEFTTYRDAIEAYCTRSSRIAPLLAVDAFSRIPDRPLERNAHLSALMLGDPLGYLCERGGCDLVIATDGTWYFASRADASAEWFAGIQDAYWRVRPGFLSLESLTLQRPRTIISYFWEHHTIRAEAVDATATVSSYGPEETRVQLTQVYLVGDDYLTLDELCTALNVTITDAQIAAAFFRPSADGSTLHPVDTALRKQAWNTIRRDWRRLWRIEFPSGNTGGWDRWRFGKLQEDGSVLPVSVECPWVEFKRVIVPNAAGALEGSPWTFNHDATSSPFKAVWDDGPESGVIRFVVDETGNRQDDALPPIPGALQVSRKNGTTDTALRIVWKAELDNGSQSVTVRNLDILSREDITKARMATSFQAYAYITGRRFMPNDKTRWHAESCPGFNDGDIETVELPPNDEVQCYRTYVGGDAPTAEPDGLGAILNDDEIRDDAERRAEVYRLTLHQSDEGEGEAETFNLATLPRIVDGPVGSIELSAEGVVARTRITVGNLADQKARMALAAQRLAKRGVDVQGVRQ